MEPGFVSLSEQAKGRVARMSATGCDDTCSAYPEEGGDDGGGRDD